jgi:hypothetical protein
MIDSEIETLAVHVSRTCKWDGGDIMAVMLEALTDAKYHTLRSRLEQAYEHYKEEAF